VLFGENGLKKIMSFFLCAVCFMCQISVHTISVSAEEKSVWKLPESEYERYLKKHPFARPEEEITLEAADINGSEACEKFENYEGSTGVSLLVPDDGTVEWKFWISTAGYYNIEFLYFPIKGKSSDIEREIYVNGELPFTQAAYLTFSRIWANSGEIKQDNRDNDLRPSQIEKPDWMKAFASDSTGYSAEPYLFYFEEGENTIKLVSSKEPMLLKSMRICQTKTVPTYGQKKAFYDEQDYEICFGVTDLIEGESALLKSSPMLYPINDRSSPSTQPYHVSKIRLNSIGGGQWKVPGQWISWNVNVKKSGLYQIALKSRQNFVRGMYTNRKLTINGEVPFLEMENISFTYNGNWKMNVLADEAGEPYLFYLKEGDNVLKLEVVLGELGQILAVAENSVLELNNAYRRILMLTGAVPDPYRDYDLHIEIPDILVKMREQSEVLANLSAQLISFTGQRGSHNAILDRLAIQLKDMADNPRTIPKRLDVLKSNIGSFSQWIFNSREQPLTLDYIAVYSPDTELSEADAGFFEKIKHEINVFFTSFVEDYNSIGDVYEEAISVWVSSGRDQGQILKSMIDESFVPQKGVGVNLQIVQSGVLLSAIVADLAPDIVLQVPYNDPVNFALRGAVTDLKGFDDFEETAQRFYDSALTSYKLEGGIFALPEQQMFPVMFYRKDIMEELKINVPQTWNDVIDILPVIQKNRMDIGIPVTEGGATWNGLQTYSMLLYQIGGELYQDGGKSSGIDSDKGIEAFRKWSDFYVNYKFPMTYNVTNRFRTGEVPIAISDYSMYNVLSVFAPELRGLWGIAPVPGTMQEDGSIDRSVPGNGTACIILKNSEKQTQSWEFLKWWTGKDMQVRFAREMESLMGAAARYPTANVEAMGELPWSSKDYEVLSEQWKWVKGVPEVPGGYFTSRHLDNAFRSVVLRGTDPRETVLDYVRVINKEIDIKREEFDLPLGE